MDSISKPRKQKQTYRSWADWVCNTIWAMTGPEGWAEIGSHPPLGLYVVPRPGCEVPPWLKDDPGMPWVEPMELLVAHRCPFDNAGGAPPGGDYWVWWTEQAAKGLGVRKDWVRFFMHATRPLAIGYHKNRDVHAIWAGWYWATLLDIPQERGQVLFEESLAAAQKLNASSPRMSFWQTEVSEPSLWE